jgi:hypothetical protein
MDIKKGDPAVTGPNRRVSTACFPCDNASRMVTAAPTQTASSNFTRFMLRHLVETGSIDTDKQRLVIHLSAVWITEKLWSSLEFSERDELLEKALAAKPEWEAWYNKPFLTHASHAFKVGLRRYWFDYRFARAALRIADTVQRLAIEDAQKGDEIQRMFANNPETARQEEQSKAAFTSGNYLRLDSDQIRSRNWSK